MKTLCLCFALWSTFAMGWAQQSPTAIDAQVQACLRVHPASRQVLGSSFNLSQWVLHVERITTNEALKNNPLTTREILEQQKIVEALYNMLGQCTALEKMSSPITNIRNALRKSIVVEETTQQTENNQSLFGQDTHTVKRIRFVGSFKTIKAKRKEIKKMKRILKL